MSGYVYCACRDCPDIAIGKVGELCNECGEAGCEEYDEQDYVSWYPLVRMYECQRDDAYEG
jgi:hypothetical protein